MALRQRVAWQGSKIEGEGARFYTSGFTRLFFVLATSFLHCRSDRNKPRLSLRLAPVRASFPRSAVCENMSTASAVCLYERIHWSFCITYHPNAPREPRERHGSTISTPENTCYGFHQCAGGYHPLFALCLAKPNLQHLDLVYDCRQPRGASLYTIHQMRTPCAPLSSSAGAAPAAGPPPPCEVILCFFWNSSASFCLVPSNSVIFAMVSEI